MAGSASRAKSREWVIPQPALIVEVHFCAASGERLRNLWPDVQSVSAVFSPDGRSLLASAGREFRLFETTDWKSVWQHAREDGSDGPAPITFSPVTEELRLRGVE